MTVVETNVERIYSKNFDRLGMIAGSLNASPGNILALRWHR